MESELTQNALNEMNKTSSWMTFYSVVFFIAGIALLFFGGYFSSLKIFMLNTGVIGIIIASVGVLLAITGYFALKYANHLKTTALQKNLSELEKGFFYYKIYLVFVGVLSILDLISSWSKINIASSPK